MGSRGGTVIRSRGLEPYPSEGRTCDIRIWKGDSTTHCQYEGDCSCSNDCRVGCFAPARFLNPNYPDEGFYNYAKWLCAEHYDEVMGQRERKKRGTLTPIEEIIYEKIENDGSPEPQDV